MKNVIFDAMAPFFCIIILNKKLKEYHRLRYDIFFILNI